MKRKKKILGILMSAIMIFSMSSQFALAGRIGSDASSDTIPGISTEKEAEPSTKVVDQQEKETPATDKSTDKNDSAKENDKTTKTDKSAEKNESEELSYNQRPITTSKASNGVSVTVKAPKGSFPAGTIAFIKPVSALESNVTFDITFTDRDGKEVQPRKGKDVSVDFTVAASSTLIAKKGSTELSVYHIDSDGSPDMIGTATTKSRTAKIETKASHFSDFLVRSEKASTQTRGSAKKVDATVKNLTIQNLSGNTIDKIYYTDKFYLAMNWDASSNGANLHEGDYFDITLPDKMVFPSDSAAVDFNIYGDDGTTVIAKAHVTPGPGNKGGTVRATFTDWVEGKENVKGNIHLAAQFDREQVTINEENTFQITVNGEVVSVSVTVDGPKELDHEILGKWGGSADDKNQAQWNIRINHHKATLNNAVISDHLSKGTGSETYIADSFLLHRVEMNAFGHVSKVYETVNLDGKLAIAADGKSFTLNLGNVNGEQYRLYYKTTYTPGTMLRNNMTLTSTEQSKTTSAGHISADSGGSGTGDLANKIKLIKVDADDHSIVLAGAVFEVTRPDGSTFELTTGADGTVTSGYLTQGTYTVKEKTPPAGYVLNDKSYTLKVNACGGAIQTITDKKAKTEVKVTKAWNDSNNQDGKRPNAVTVHLLADEVDTGKMLTLTEAEHWKGTFSGLDKYNENGAEIKYTISEDAVSGYKAEITGDAAAGYTITNTHTPEKISINGSKTWEDNNDQDGARPESITVRLHANGTEIRSKFVSAADNWSWEFSGLPKYEDGSEIIYTVTEDTIDGYSTEVDGFDIANTHAPGKTSITITKAWDDHNDQDGKRTDSIKVQLYANGVKSGDPVTLEASNQWTHTWNDLDRKANKKDIEYTVKEVDVPEGYKAEITGDAAAGYTITNTHTPEEISINGSKTWEDNNDQDGKRPESVTIHLLADGVQIDSKTVSAGDGWAWEFSGLPKYKEGREILYTVTENAVDDYSTAYDGFDVKNTHAPGKTSITVTKTWNDEDDKDGVRPKKVTIYLLADGKDTGKTLTLSDSNDWRGSFTDLDEFKGGKKITYTVSEAKVGKYTSNIGGNAEKGFHVTNTYPVTPANGSKTGDPAKLALCTVMLLGSLAAIIYLLYRRKKDTTR